MKSLFALSGRQAFALALLFGILITLAGLGVRELESGDETRVAGIAAEMYLEGDYLIPRLNGEPFLEYPPLYYWCAAASYACFGIDDRAAKLPSALAALGCGLIVYLFARRLRLPPWCALGCCVMLMTSAQFSGTAGSAWWICCSPSASCWRFLRFIFGRRPERYGGRFSFCFFLPPPRPAGS